MNRDEIYKLLGGYATRTLTDAELHALFEAAMEDQALFDAIAEEGAFKEVLDDPHARAFLLEALPVKPKSEVRRMPVWSWAATGSVAAALVLGALLVRSPVPQKSVAKHAAASSPVQSKLDPAAPAPFQIEAAPPEAKQTTLGLAVIPPKKAGAETSSPSASPAPLPQRRRDAREAEADVKLQAEKESLAPAVVAENRQKVELSAATDAVRALPAPAGQAAESPTFSTASSGSQLLLDSAVQIQQSARQLFYNPIYSPGAAAGFVTGRPAAPAKAKRIAALPAGTPSLRYTLLCRQPDGSFLEADPSAIFHPGDAVRLRIETNAAGYLAVWSGHAALANLSVLARTKYTIPTEGAIDLNGPPGDRRLLVMFSRTLQTKPAGLAGGLLVEQSTEHATYVADPRPSPLVSFEISLAYR